MSEVTCTITTDSAVALVDVVIVNWNSGQYLSDCLESLSRVEQPSELHIVVIDNASTDGSAEVAGDFKLIRNEENRGFAAACNQGAGFGSAEQLLFLNPDARVEPDSIRLASNYLRQHPDVAVVGVRLLDGDGVTQRSCARAPTMSSMLSRTLGLDRLWPRSGYLMTDWAHDVTRAVDHVIGAFYLIRRDVFDELKGFDERFFVYLEDMDLSCRVREAGYAVHFLAEAVAHHTGGGSSGNIPAQRLFLSQKARLQFARKYFHTVSYAIILLSTLTLEPLVRITAAILAGSKSGVNNVADATSALWRWVCS